MQVLRLPFLVTSFSSKHSLLVGQCLPASSLPSGVFDKEFTYGHLCRRVRVGPRPEEHGAPLPLDLCDHLPVEEAKQDGHEEALKSRRNWRNSLTHLRKLAGKVT